ncbi:hypothetical protein CYMTET_32246 [Cymbomonas tetramitiformis]|uniref:Uncharacterized protein n=1 Tax=Cymbomonas tetramitiformis TaxID=36881 RepID=A0AAE0FFN8_9CHLO|nr:hypothetical protein CYMTET_32246 [Cymbomonas tetramitiformis]
MRPSPGYHHPKNIQCMELMASALKTSFGKIQSMDSTEEVTIEDPDAAHREMLMRKLTALNKDKLALLKLLQSSRTLKALQEIKSYSKPPEVLVRVMVSLFVLLEVNGFEVRFIAADCSYSYSSPACM